MSKLVQVLLFALVGYGIAAVAGYFLVMSLSSNRHDRAVEAAMTAVFFIGPIGALVAGAIAYFKAGA